MYRDLDDILDMLRTPLGRRQILHGVFHSRAWPLLRRLASLHRRTLARRTRVVAVVGSLGKTTTSRAVTVALGRTPHPWINLNEYSYLASALLRIRPRERHAVIEVGIMNRGEMARYAEMLRPNIVVVTSVGSEHN